MSHTQDPLMLVAAAARLCYSKKKPSEVYKGLTKEAAIKLVNDIKNSGHMSPFEHVVFTFGVSGISRVATHQLVRHRLASYSQQSQRYVTMRDNSITVPPYCETDEECAEVFAEAFGTAQYYYDLFVAMGMDKEDARYILPQGSHSNVIFTMNARELIHFFELRLCSRAQWEIRELANKMLALVKGVAPELFSKVGPACTHEKCKEPKERRCGAPYKYKNKKKEEEDRFSDWINWEDGLVEGPEELPEWAEPSEDKYFEDEDFLDKLPNREEPSEDKDFLDEINDIDEDLPLDQLAKSPTKGKHPIKSDIFGRAKGLLTDPRRLS